MSDPGGSPAGLVARTTLGDPADAEPPATIVDGVVAVASPRRAMWGHGEAVRIDLPAPWPDHVGLVADVLASIPADGPDHPASGPVAFGALPYDRSAPATLVVPERLHGRSSDGDRWTTLIGTPEELDGPTAVQLVAVPPPPRSVEVRSVERPTAWSATVDRATQRIRAGELTKVVLARELAITWDEPVPPVELFRRFRAVAPGAHCYCVDGFVGASPELLVSRLGDVVRAHPMAGTTPRTGDPEVDQRRAGELLGSQKNRAEHQITIDVVHDTLLPWCSYLDAEPEPSVVAAGPVQHLASLVEGRLSQPAPSALELVAALHPTPAVGGWPRDAALALQAELEDADRGRYAGPVGWVDRRGNGSWFVGIRGLEVDGTTGRLFAGVGVVADSDPAAELEETRAKAQAVLAPLLRL